MMRASLGVYEQLELSLDRAIAFVLAHRSTEGRLIGGCSGRALESALVLHLFRRTDHAPQLHAGLAAFCHRARLQDPAELSHASQLDRRLSDVICELVLDGGLGPSGLTALGRALTAFDHPTLWRKRVFPQRPYRNFFQFLQQMARLGPGFWGRLMR